MESRGRYRIKRTLPKKIVQFSLWIMIAVYLCLYFAYITIVLVWFMLGAVLNPHKYLPYASATATLLMFIKTKRDYVRSFYQIVKDKVISLVMEQTGFLYASTFKAIKEEKLVQGIMGGDVAKKTQFFLAKSMARLFEKGGCSITPNQLIAIANGE